MAAERTVAQSLQEYGRGIAGGLLFSLPLLYTQEVWHAGATLHLGRVALGLVVTFALLLGYNRYAGLHKDASFGEVLIDSVEELGLALLLSAAFLWMLGQLGGDTPLNETLGKLVVAALPVAIGVSVGTAQFAGDDDDQGMTDAEGGDARAISLAEQATLATCGAVLVAVNVAPTEEIILIAFETTPLRLLLLALVSLTLCVVILFFSGFSGADRLTPTRTPLDIAAGTVLTYTVALLSAAVILWFFGRLDGLAPMMAVASTVVLALPGALGASAGRLLLAVGKDEG
ncbi:MAG: TIGR02587 family membrane protein [Chloroflexales bacterium]|nr:TIGR02587 family membrane protein [Chloroflexales bacterium]